MLVSRVNPLMRYGFDDFRRCLMTLVAFKLVSRYRGTFYLSAYLPPWFPVAPTTATSGAEGFCEIVMIRVRGWRRKMIAMLIRPMILAFIGDAGILIFTRYP